MAQEATNTGEGREHATPYVGEHPGGPSPASFRKASTPDVVKLHQVGCDTIAAGWSTSDGATSYRPYMMMEGVDEEFIALPLTRKTSVLLGALPANATIHFQVAAWNAAGESGRSDVVSLTLR